MSCTPQWLYLGLPLAKDSRFSAKAHLRAKHREVAFHLARFPCLNASLIRMGLVSLCEVVVVLAVAIGVPFFMQLPDAQATQGRLLICGLVQAPPPLPVPAQGVMHCSHQRLRLQGEEALRLSATLAK